MADLRDMGFDARNVEPAKDMGAIPAGDYPVVLVASERKVNSKGTGELLSLQFSVLNGDYQNRKLYANLNIRNANPQAQQIAWAELSALCRAVEVLSPGDTQELHGIPLIVTVKVDKDGDRGPQNRITGYKHRNAGRPSPQPAPSNQQPANGQYVPPGPQQQQLDPFGNGPTPPPPASGVYRQPVNAASGKTW